MQKEVVLLILKFMERVDLKGGEVPAFNAVINALREMVETQETSEKEPISA